MGVRRAEDLKEDVARGTACDGSVIARVMQRGYGSLTYVPHES